MRNNLNTEYKLVGVSEAIRQLGRDIEIAASHDDNILITGETGTGKEIVARQIHAKSARCEKPFIAVHCGAIPTDLIESELFGHKKGSFTGAICDQAGKLELAYGGTVMLDEIGTMSISLQPKILRWLEDGEFYPVGGHVPVRSDARVISAMNGTLTPDNLREDVLYRICIDCIHVPALRERNEDIMPIVEFYLDRLNESKNTEVKLDDSAREALMGHNYPGNIRELENIVRYAFLHRNDGVITGDVINRRIKAMPQYDKRA